MEIWKEQFPEDVQVEIEFYAVKRAERSTEQHSRRAFDTSKMYLLF
jgi:hypothetical protein